MKLISRVFYRIEAARAGGLLCRYPLSDRKHGGRGRSRLGIPADSRAAAVPPHGLYRAPAAVLYLPLGDNGSSCRRMVLDAAFSGRRDVAFDGAADLLAHVLDLVERGPPILRRPILIQRGKAASVR